jgi:DNA gyrase/topoisomerase IV subunit A
VRRLAIGHDARVKWEDPELTASDLEMRLEITEGLIWATEHPDDLLAVVTSEPTLDEAKRRLMTAPYMLTGVQTIHVLDTPVRRFSPENAAELHAQADRFRARLEALPAP